MTPILLPRSKNSTNQWDRQYGSAKNFLWGFIVLKLLNIKKSTVKDQ
jgi:hypothetical protein